jgi:ribonuclease P protein component
VLPAERRVRRPEDFSVAVSEGRRVSGPGLVVHRRTTVTATPSRAGFVVGRGVGTAVVRNRVRRQLRHLLASRLQEFPAGVDLVIRVLPAAATLSRRDLAATLHRLLDRLLPTQPDLEQVTA